MYLNHNKYSQNPCSEKPGNAINKNTHAKISSRVLCWAQEKPGAPPDGDSGSEEEQATTRENGAMRQESTHRQRRKLHAFAQVQVTTALVLRVRKLQAEYGRRMDTWLAGRGAARELLPAAPGLLDDAVQSANAATSGGPNGERQSTRMGAELRWSGCHQGIALASSGLRCASEQGLG